MNLVTMIVPFLMFLYVNHSLPDSEPISENLLVSWDRTEYDFGKIEQGVPQSTIFTLTNLADAPMLLTKVKGSCGCTATDYEKGPIAPGKSTTIKATFNAKSVGTFSKTITVQTNLQDDPMILTIKGQVLSD
jgi:hypothetical protein